ncbi:hypothetical protein [Lysinibacillus odysseyi]|uniref:Topoisomerase n=1 Tax=Lysinibacillus odysseyi 34hs-1 = NBRC 100172 TaxID=1220589 RepID=A0A0A3INA8_9BACI|nr:hypothetical protein [Lysinibacillus odysseyi]KGR84283.1 hypothetical protein CD32_11830 [Lysinibacillus odysseyi 34hs-1 = NBRC 100172]
MFKKATIISGIVVISILLVGCNGESKVEVLDDSKNDVNLLPESELNILSELKNEIIASIAEPIEIDSESIIIIVGGNLGTGTIELSVCFPENLKVDDTNLQQIVEDSIKNVSEKENIAGEEAITIKIERY